MAAPADAHARWNLARCRAALQASGRWPDGSGAALPMDISWLTRLGGGVLRQQQGGTPDTGGRSLPLRALFCAALGLSLEAGSTHGAVLMGTVGAHSVGPPFTGFLPPHLFPALELSPQLPPPGPANTLPSQDTDGWGPHPLRVTSGPGRLPQGPGAAVHCDLVLSSGWLTGVSRTVLSGRLCSTGRLGPSPSGQRLCLRRPDGSSTAEPSVGGAGGRLEDGRSQGPCRPSWLCPQAEPAGPVGQG